MIYTITTVNLDPMRQRCVGYHFSKDSSIVAVKRNSGDIYEDGHYPYVVIEEVAEGIYMYDSFPIWFKWGENGYEEIDAPEEYKNVCGWGIG